MREIVGNNVEIFLKGRRSDAGDNLSGLLIEVTDRTVYIQAGSERVVVIPRENIEYCITDSLPPKSREFIGSVMPRNNKTPATPERNKAPDPLMSQALKDAKPEEITRLDVFINNEIVAGIPIPPTFPVKEWNDKIMRVIMGNPNVKMFLAGKIQKQIEYRPGRVYIEVEEVVPPSQIPEVVGGNYENTFSMGASPSAEFLNPSQMVSRLNKVVKDKQNVEKE